MLQLKSVTSQDIELRSNDEVVIINQGFLKYYLENKACKTNKDR